ncbi:hypothetical protein GOBAR_AA33419 [Gossypium barbadense]|uniref:Uncharacterized protein n=1 Tax=Gossypium barbadense TaxID=3634 RepID=A0A2P5W871_GOSBA|nr:hypothetical protein GOBAR_AA33419 [Gossypium barbadense]
MTLKLKTHYYQKEVQCTLRVVQNIEPFGTHRSRKTGSEGDFPDAPHTAVAYTRVAALDSTDLIQNPRKEDIKLRHDE